MNKFFTIALTSLFFLPAVQSDGIISYPKKGKSSTISNKPGYKSGLFFNLKLKNGARIGNIFSRTITYSAPGFKESVNRVSGTCIYTVTNDNPYTPAFDCEYYYDGAVQGNSKLIVKDNGKIAEYNGKPGINTDGSGLMFNSFIWGFAPPIIRIGTKWQVHIPQPWELGGPGSETITVIDIDAKNHKITLQRKGESDGFYDGESKNINLVKDGKVYLFSINPGRSSWIGQTVFKDGLVQNDELMVIRQNHLSNDSLSVNGTQREYIILNSMPTS